MSTARSYYGQKGGLRNPFGSSGKKTKQPEKLPRHPRRADLLKQISCHLATEHMDNEGPWSVAAFDVWFEEVAPLKDRYCKP
ncbi:hypothetical protein [Hymenobacter guriensis]|uniref:Uncharacterized protein n=1 Tax=Hymenobacter guriensis TaxID=2793065 RepID=A0ABS0KWT0_9BACT|nr:hypothetical protein [Hymenobacter guriensis]MBG8552327.1 hypothetical protein [Hymenobacter guriensis]